MKPAAIFTADILASLAMLEWTRRGPWIRLLGFSMYHSRGDVWLPTPPAAMDFFRAMVLAGTSMFVVLFIIASTMIYRAARQTDPSQRAHFILESFYGHRSKLIVKYSAFVLISIVSPFFFHWMWFFRLTRAQRIAGGFALMLTAFALLLVLGDLIVGRVAADRRITVTA